MCSAVGRRTLGKRRKSHSSLLTAASFSLLFQHRTCIVLFRIDYWFMIGAELARLHHFNRKIEFNFNFGIKNQLNILSNGVICLGGKKHKRRRRPSVTAKNQYNHVSSSLYNCLSSPGINYNDGILLLLLTCKDEARKKN